MAEPLLDRRPMLIVVAGRPGSGKTTLAHSLARAVRCPAICRDEIKEGIVHSLDPTSVDADVIQRHANDAFFKTIETLLQHGATLIAEAAFQHKLWAPGLEPLLPTARSRIILCAVNPELARSRHIKRSSADPERERFHPDPVVQSVREGRQLPIANYDPPHFDVPTLVVDTTDGYGPPLGEIVSFARGENRAEKRGRTLSSPAIPETP